jgi:hypothetical protein
MLSASNLSTRHPKRAINPFRYCNSLPFKAVAFSTLFMYVSFVKINPLNSSALMPPSQGLFVPAATNAVVLY